MLEKDKPAYLVNMSDLRLVSALIGINEKRY